MSQTSHTPGPWRAQPARTTAGANIKGYWNIRAAGVNVADVTGELLNVHTEDTEDGEEFFVPYGQSAADAALIAAAPDLLAALSHAVAMVEAHLDRCGVKKGDPALLLSPALDEWRVAIATAEGREP